MRQLKVKDLAPFTKILSKMEIRDLLKGLFTKNEDNESRGRAILSELAVIIVDNYYKVEDDFMKFLADINEKSPEDIREMPIGEFIGLITDMLSKENIPFFKSAVK